MEIRPLVECDNQLGEGPLWDVAEQRIYWIDSFGQKILRCTESGSQLECWEVPQTIGAMALRQSGGAILSLADGFHLFDFESGRTETLHLVNHKAATNRVNDGKVDRGGRFVSGSMDTSEASPSGILYSVGRDRIVRILDEDITVSNGPCWSPDGSILYFSDSRARTIWRYDYDLDTGSARNRRPFAQFSEEDGYPDGATVDSEGFVWSAGVFKGKIHRFRPDGTRDGFIDFPALCVTSVMFGGSDLSTMFVTTMNASPFPEVGETGPKAGSLFTVSGLGVKGIPETRFAG